MNDPGRNAERDPGRVLAFSMALPSLQAVAREHGYALALHGSMTRDLDLIACPWVEDAAPAEALIEALRAHVGGFILNNHRAAPGEPSNAERPVARPHGRLGWSIRLNGTRAYLDVSVMPRLEPSP